MIKDFFTPWTYIQQEVEKTFMGESYIELEDSDYRYKDDRYQCDKQIGYEGTSWWTDMNEQEVAILKSKLVNGILPLKRSNRRPPCTE